MDIYPCILSTEVKSSPCLSLSKDKKNNPILGDLFSLKSVEMKINR